VILLERYELKWSAIMPWSVSSASCGCVKGYDVGQDEYGLWSGGSIIGCELSATSDIERQDGQEQGKTW
jgi:hypothetical protein